MIRQPLQEEEAAASAKRELSVRMKWRALWVFIIGLALLFAVVAALTFTGHAALVLSIWGQTITAVYAVALLTYFVVTMSRSYIPSIEAGGSRLMRRRIDEFQGRWRWQILLQVVAVLPFFAYLPQVFWVFGSAHPFMRAVVALLVFELMLTLVFLLSAGPGLQGMAPGLAPDLLNDEFVTALRARMMRFAYVLTMLLLGGVLVVFLWRPDLTLRALCWALYASFAVPALYYVIADWRASSADQEHDG